MKTMTSTGNLPKLSPSPPVLLDFMETKVCRRTPLELSKFIARPLPRGSEVTLSKGEGLTSGAAVFATGSDYKSDIFDSLNYLDLGVPTSVKDEDKFTIERTWDRARILLLSKVEQSPGAYTELSAILRELEWLPAIDCHRTKVLANTTQCYGLDNKLLVGLVHSHVPFDIAGDWRQRLSWNEVIPISTLLAQLERGIEKEDRKDVNAVLKNVQGEGQLETYYKQLIDLRYVLNQNSYFVSLRIAFHTGCERLEPYLYNIDNSFWHDNSSLLQGLGIREKPDVKDLPQIQREFQPRKETGEASIKEADIAVEIEIIKLTAVFDRDRPSTLMIVSVTESLCIIEDTTYNDLEPLSSVQGTTNSTHPDIPYSVITKLRIEPLTERIKKGQLGLADIDDNEFDQREEVADGINDTLERHPVEAMFKEHLANTDDTGSATQINWLLDARQYPQVSLATPELLAYKAGYRTARVEKSLASVEGEASVKLYPR